MNPKLRELVKNQFPDRESAERILGMILEIRSNEPQDWTGDEWLVASMKRWGFVAPHPIRAKRLMQ